MKSIIFIVIAITIITPCLVLFYKNKDVDFIWFTKEGVAYGIWPWTHWSCTASANFWGIESEAMFIAGGAILIVFNLLVYIFIVKTPSTAVFYSIGTNSLIFNCSQTFFCDMYTLDYMPLWNNAIGNLQDILVYVGFGLGIISIVCHLIPLIVEFIKNKIKINKNYNVNKK